MSDRSGPNRRLARRARLAVVRLEERAVPAFVAVGPQTNVAPGDPAGPASQKRPAVGVDAAGRAIALYEHSDATTFQDVYGQFTNASATPTGSPFLVNTYTPQQQYYPSVAVAPDGRFVVAWGSLGEEGDQ